MRILFVGLSNKIGREPFDINTNSGKIVHDIIGKLNHDCYVLNLVQYAPVNIEGKLRYPNKCEINDSIPSFLKRVDELKPDLIIAFGKIVSNELYKIKGIEDKLLTKQHPSYVYIYKKKTLDNYVRDIIENINSYFM